MGVIILKKILSNLEKNILAIANMDSNVSIKACKEVRIEGCKRILECNEVLIRIRTIDCNVIVWGEELKLECYNENIITVYGEISSVEFEVRLK